MTDDEFIAKFNYDAFIAHRDNSGMIVRGGNGGELDIQSRMPKNPQEPIADGFAVYAIVDKTADEDGVEEIRYHIVTGLFCRWCGRKTMELTWVCGCTHCDRFGDWPTVRKAIQ